MLAFIFILCYYVCKVKVNKILRGGNLMSSIHNKPEILIPPKRVCMNPSRLFESKCKENVIILKHAK